MGRVLFFTYFDLETQTVSPIDITLDQRNCRWVHFADQRAFVSFVFRHWQVGTERFVCLCTRAFTFVTTTEGFDGEACHRWPMIDGRIRTGGGGGCGTRLIVNGRWRRNLVISRGEGIGTQKRFYLVPIIYFGVSASPKLRHYPYRPNRDGVDEETRGKDKDKVDFFLNILRLSRANESRSKKTHIRSPIEHGEP